MDHPAASCRRRTLLLSSQPFSPACMHCTHTYVRTYVQRSIHTFQTYIYMHTVRLRHCTFLLFMIKQLPGECNTTASNYKHRQTGLTG